MLRTLDVFAFQCVSTTCFGLCRLLGWADNTSAHRFLHTIAVRSCPCLLIGVHFSCPSCLIRLAARFPVNARHANPLLPCPCPPTSSRFRVIREHTRTITHACTNDTHIDAKVSSAAALVLQVKQQLALALRCRRAPDVVVQLQAPVHEPAHSQAPRVPI